MPILAPSTVLYAIKHGGDTVFLITFVVAGPVLKVLAPPHSTEGRIATAARVMVAFIGLLISELTKREKKCSP